MERNRYVPWNVAETVTKDEMNINNNRKDYFQKGLKNIRAFQACCDLTVNPWHKYQLSVKFLAVCQLSVKIQR